MENQGRPSSCSDLDKNPVEVAATTIHASVSLPSLSGSHQSLSTLSRRQQRGNGDNGPVAGAASLGACDFASACGSSQKVMEKLVERLFDLENERAELLAANRTWATQFQLMQERHAREVKDLKTRLVQQRKEAEPTHQQRHGEPPGMTWSETKEQMDVLKHQAEVYREDFLEERKSRVRAHAQLETLRNELKRERKSRAKLVSIVNESTRARDEPPKVCN